MAILNYTTQKSADDTLAEIQKILVKHGARKISVDYNSDGLPANLTFTTPFKDQMMFFSLPCRFEKVHKVIMNQTNRSEYRTKEQAIRTGWRILKDWIEAQMAIIETEAVDFNEAFLPYGVTKTGERLYDYLKNLENNNPLMLNQ